MPKGFVRIRHYGIVSSTSKLKCTVVIKVQVKAPQAGVIKKDTTVIYHPRQCPCCKVSHRATHLAEALFAL
jgi:hypothetical protein